MDEGDGETQLGFPRPANQGREKRYFHFGPSNLRFLTQASLPGGPLVDHCVVWCALLKQFFCVNMPALCLSQCFFTFC